MTELIIQSFKDDTEWMFFFFCVFYGGDGGWHESATTIGCPLQIKFSLPYGP